MRALGASQQDIAAAQAALAAQADPPQEQEFGVWEENWPAWVFFCSLVTQWETVSLTTSVPGPMGGAITTTEVRRAGLPSPRVESTARLQGIARSSWPAIFADIQRMERAVLAKDTELLAARRRE
jgi:hypothetical protein